MSVEIIDSDFDKYQEDLDKMNRRIKYVVGFELDDEVDEAINGLTEIDIFKNEAN